MPYLPADPPLSAADLVGMKGSLDGRGTEGWLPGRVEFFGSGRAALLAALHAVGVGSGEDVLLPSYLCESVVSPVKSVGARPVFFPVGRDLRPDLEALEAAVSPHTRAVTVIHYYGFPGPVQQLRRLCQRRGLVLIEDCAHALFSRLEDRLLGSFGDAAFFSPWKSLPLPDGGLLALKRPRNGASATMRPPSAAATTARLAYRSLGSLESVAGWSPRLALLRRSTLRRKLHDRTSGALVQMRAGSGVAWRLLQAAQAGRIVGQRRQNYARLIEVARRLSWARPLFEDLPVGVCPLGLPLVVEQRDRWRDELLKSGVNVRTYWEHLPAEVNTDRFPEAAWLRDRILVLPVHQGLRSRQIDWLARRLTGLGSGKVYGALAHR